MSDTNINGKDDGRLYWKNLANILREELDAERTTKNILRDILRDTYEKLEQELADTKKKLEKVQACNEYHGEEMFKAQTELEAFKKESDDKLREALEVIGFYGDVENWDESDICHTDVNNDRTIDYEGQKDRTGGKRARSFLKKHTKNIGDETKKISEQTKMEG